MAPELPQSAFDLVAGLVADEEELISIGWLRSLLTPEEQRALAKLDYERALERIEE
jgi:hypothetical protein